MANAGPLIIFKLIFSQVKTKNKKNETVTLTNTQTQILKQLREHVTFFNLLHMRRRATNTPYKQMIQLSSA